MKIVHLNAFSIKNKYVELQDYLYDNDIDICAITETWLDNNVDSTEFTPDDYLCFHKDRNLDFYNEGTYSETARSGALLLIKRNLNPVLYPKGDVPAEVVWCKVFTSPKTEVLVGVVYRPKLGGESNLAHICNSMDSIDTDNTILVGDFNFRDTDWKTNEAPSAISKKFLACVEEKLLFQLVKEPTGRDNILDLVLTGNPDIVHTVMVGEKLGRSDHRSVRVDLKIPVPRIPLADRKVILYSKGDYEAFSEEVKGGLYVTFGHFYFVT